MSVDAILAEIRRWSVTETFFWFSLSLFYLSQKVQAAALQNQGSLAPKDPPTFEAIAEANIPPPALEEVADAKIEYLELDHTKNEERPPPRPPKPEVEYFDLDAQKTKALQDVTEERQKESQNKTT